MQLSQTNFLAWCSACPGEWLKPEAWGWTGDVNQSPMIIGTVTPAESVQGLSSNLPNSRLPLHNICRYVKEVAELLWEFGNLTFSICRPKGKSNVTSKNFSYSEKSHIAIMLWDAGIQLNLVPENYFKSCVKLPRNNKEIVDSAMKC